jgi:hypothetical protein
LTSVLVASLAEDLFVPQVSLLEKVLRALLVFAFLVAALRLGGKRELGQIKVMDLAVLLLASNALQNAMIGAENSLVGASRGRRRCSPQTTSSCASSSAAGGRAGSWRAIPQSCSSTAGSGRGPCGQRR